MKSNVSARVQPAMNERSRAATRTTARGTIGLLAGLLLIGCAGLLTEKPPEEQVRERAQAWADALLADDLKRAYSYTSPAYRSFASMGVYHARVQGTGSWKSATVRTVDCAEKRCLVTFDLEYPTRVGDGIVKRPRKYRWVESAGQWWLYVAP